MPNREARPPAVISPECQAPGPRLLIIRFSSFGDIIQATAVPQAFQEKFPTSKIHWLVRADFKALLEQQANIEKIIPFDRSLGFFSLIALAWRLGRSGYEYIYDAHSNVRSLIVMTVLRAASIGNGRRYPKFAKRPKERLKRLLFFRFRIQTFPMPYRGAESFLWPLKKWGISGKVPEGAVFDAQAGLSAETQTRLSLLKRPWVVVAASAAWPMKRWPEAHFAKFIELCGDVSFILLGGPEDSFLRNLESAAHPERTLNLAGKLSLLQSATVTKLADLVVANDTGVLHVADQMARPTIALIGPTAFGYPSHPDSDVAEIDLWCKPCSKDGRGKCMNTLYQRCLVELTPERVAAIALKKLAAHKSGAN